MVLAPLGDGVFRVGASVPHGWEQAEPDRTFFETLLQQRVPGARRLGRMTFSGTFVAQVRSAGSFRQGREFLLGDAAHVMSPSGAQGLNTGIQDAVNLGWKLAGVVTGRYRADLLDRGRGAGPLRRRDGPGQGGPGPVRHGVHRRARRLRRGLPGPARTPLAERDRRGHPPWPDAPC